MIIACDGVRWESVGGTLAFWEGCEACETAADDDEGYDGGDDDALFCA